MTESNSENTQKIGKILALGLDQQDGHVRLTQGEDFKVMLGSEASHREMQQLCIAIEKRLAERGEKLGDVPREVFEEILLEIAAEQPLPDVPGRD